jgi:CheY-like chemotaxis protein
MDGQAQCLYFLSLVGTIPIPHPLQSIVSLLGWISDTATNGEEALDLVSQVTPELVLSDVNMPKMDGIDLIRALMLQFPFGFQ